MLRHQPLFRICTALCAAFLLPAVLQVRAETFDTNPLNREPDVQAAFERVYAMDYSDAIDRFEKIQQQHPGNPMATDYVLDAVVFQELNRQDLLDSTFYANDGFLTGKHTVVPDPQAQNRIRSLGTEALGEANAELKSNPRDVNALFARGWAKALEAVYSGMAQRAFGAGLKQALSARTDCDRVLQLDPNYTDAKLVTGVYQYVVGALPIAFKLIFGFVGIHGSKTQGMAMLQDDAVHGTVTQVEARTAMMLFLRREGKYQQAAQIAQGLAEKYPHGFLFQLEQANLQKDGGEGMTAVATYDKLLAEAKQPGYFHSAHVELAYFGLGEALRGQRHYAAAVEAYREGASQPKTSPELKRRCLLKAGESYDLMQDHAKAVQQYEAVLNAGSDTVQGELAKKYMKSAYRGK